MSGCSMTSEMTALSEAFGYDWDTLQWFTVNAMKSAFLPFAERLAIINERDQAGLRPAARRMTLSSPRLMVTSSARVSAEPNCRSMPAR